MTQFKELKELFPQAQDKILKVLRSDNPIFAKYHVNTGKRYRMFIAQMAHESARFETLEEYRYRHTSFEEKYGYKTRVGKLLGNDKPGDGEKYHGRGIIQLTGKWNYTFYGARTNLDLVNNPDLLLQPDNALIVALDYWKHKNINKAADKCDVELATRLINGGQNGLQDRLRLYRKCSNLSF